MQVVRSIQPHNTRDKCPSTKQSSAEGGELVSCFSSISRGNEFGGVVFWVVCCGGGAQVRIADEEAIVDAAGEVEGCVGLDAVSD